MLDGLQRKETRLGPFGLGHCSHFKCRYLKLGAFCKKKIKMNLFVFFFACVGLTFIVNISYIFKPIRLWTKNKNKHIGKMLDCSQCVGFWAGLTIRALDMWHQNLFLNLDWSDLYNICYGFASSFVCYAVYLLLKYFMVKYD